MNGNAGRYRRNHCISSTPTFTMYIMKATEIASATSFSISRLRVTKAKGTNKTTYPRSLKRNISWS